MISLLIAGAFVWVFKQGRVPLLPPREALAQVAWWGLPSYVAFSLLATFLRTYRWVYLLRPISAQTPASRVLGIGLVGLAAIFFAPLRAGELVRPWLLAEERQFTFLQAAGTVAAERVIDGVVLTTLTLISLLLTSPLDPPATHVGKLELPIAAIPALSYTSCATFSAAFVVMVLFYRYRSQARRVVHALLDVFSTRLANWVVARMENLSDGLRFLPSLRQSSAFIRDTLLFWASMLLGTWSLLKASGVPVTLAQAGVVLGVMGLGMLIPGGPGFFGTYQLATYCGLATFFAERMVLREGVTFAFVSYSVQLLVTLAGGVLGLLLLTGAKPSARGSA